MSTKRKAAVVELEDPEIARYEQMSDAQVEKELAKFGIDPRPTIKAVTELVTNRVAEWRKRQRSARRRAG